MNFLYVFFVLLTLIVVIPVTAAFLLVYVFALGFDFLDFSVTTAILALFFMIVTSFINIPIGRKDVVEVVEPRFFGFFRRSVRRFQGVSINVGGAVIPLLIIGFFLPSLWEAGLLRELGVIVAIISVFSFVTSHFIKEKGVVISMILPVLFTALFAAILAPEEAAKIAFSGGVLGVLIGSDILHLPYVLKKEKSVVSIGGAGIFDGIFLVGIISAVLAGISI